MQRRHTAQSVFEVLPQLPVDEHVPLTAVSPEHEPHAPPVPQRAPVPPSHCHVLAQSPPPHAELTGPPPVAQVPPQQN